jgi:hypothetical protein
MEKLEQAILECSNSDYSLYYQSIEDKAKYILSIAKEILNKEDEEKKRIEYENYLEDLINSVN